METVRATVRLLTDPNLPMDGEATKAFMVGFMRAVEAPAAVLSEVTSDYHEEEDELYHAFRSGFRLGQTVGRLYGPPPAARSEATDPAPGHGDDTPDPATGLAVLTLRVTVPASAAHANAHARLVRFVSRPEFAGRHAAVTQRPATAFEAAAYDDAAPPPPPPAGADQ